MLESTMKALCFLLLIPTALATGCGGKSAEEIAREMSQAAKATRSGGEVGESEAALAGKRAACDALSAYTSKPATSLAEQFKKYAEQQRVLARLQLNDVDPDYADRMAAAAEGIDGSQKSGEVLDALSCD
jgi:hypothetical protein